MKKKLKGLFPITDDLKSTIDERQRQAGRGVPINITDLVVQHFQSNPPPGLNIQLVSQDKAREVAETAWEVVLKTAMKNFRLSDQQQQRFDKWNTRQNDIIRARNNGVLNIGASGGHITFEITPSGMGTVLIVKNTLTGGEIDLTEY